MDVPPSSGDLLVILNPTANRGKMQRPRALVRRRLAQEKGDYVETKRPGEARELALHAAREGRPVIVVGGDGTINEVVNGILSSGRHVPLGIIAAGSGNDFAWNTLKLPRDPATAVERAFAGRLIDVDAGTVNGTYFANSFSVGLDADIAEAFAAMTYLSFLPGSVHYYAAVLRRLLFGYQRCPRLTFRLDDRIQETPVEQRYVLIAVTNGPSYGAGFHINPRADCCDGLLDVCTIDYTPLIRALRLLPVVKAGKHASLPEVTFYRAKTVHIESVQPVCTEVDGETSHTTHCVVQVLPGALSIRV